MQATPLFLGACALVSVAGAVSGAGINTNPIQRGGIGMNEITRPSIDLGADLSEQPALPDHYAMNTPEGQVEVVELTTRGLYAQARYGWREATWNPPPMPAIDYSEDYREPVADPAVAAAEEAADAAVQVASFVHAEADQQTEGSARLIDVDQALAGG